MNAEKLYYFNLRYRVNGARKLHTKSKEEIARVTV